MEEGWLWMELRERDVNVMDGWDGGAGRLDPRRYIDMIERHPVTDSSSDNDLLLFTHDTYILFP